MWVRSEYAGELAVLSTWLCAVAPWAVTWVSREEASGYFFWFHPLNLLFIPEIDLPGERPLWVWGFLDVPLYIGETYVTYFWLGGAAIFAVALGFSIVYYLDEDRIQSLPLDPVRTLGGLLVASGLLLVGAYVLLVQNHIGTTLPVGLCLQLLLGVILLQTERVERGTDTNATAE
jgi:hypothetical protein